MIMQHIAGYKFIQLIELSQLQSMMVSQANTFDLRGTILLSSEGININLAGSLIGIHQFKQRLEQDERFSGMRFHEYAIDKQVYKRLKVKIKKEIITMRQPSIDVTTERAPAIAPEQLKQWLDERRDITLLDTRNDFEVDYGTFDQAVNLHINRFSELPDAAKQLDHKKPVVMFCTGGIRCEKAAQYFLENGFDEVYQLDGGILGYFSKIGGAHYRGGCYVFDERECVTP